MLYVLVHSHAHHTLVQSQLAHSRQKLEVSCSCLTSDLTCGWSQPLGSQPRLLGLAGLDQALQQAGDQAARASCRRTVHDGSQLPA